MTDDPMTTLKGTILEGKAVMRAHHNRGENGYAYSFYVVDFPRLSFMDIVHKGPALKKTGKREERVWIVDGVQVESLEAALEAMKAPVVLSDEEREILALIPTEWTPNHELRDEITRKRGGAAEIEYGGNVTHHERHPIRSAVSRVFWSLKEKGLIEAEARKTGEVDKLFGQPKMKSFCRRRPTEATS